MLSGDDRFAGKSVNNRFCYPAQKGLRGFCDSAAARLKEPGVDIFMSSGVCAIRDAADRVVVTAGGHPVLRHDYMLRGGGFPFEFARHLYREPQFAGVALRR